MWQKYGQHFLHNESVLHDTVRCILKLAEKENIQHCTEIWPWKWALTKLLLEEFKELDVYEVDTSLRKDLEILTKKYQWMKIFWWDILEQETWTVRGTLIVGNLPYYITSPIFRKFFVDSEEFSWWVFLIQKEVADKIKSDAQKKSYLWWLLNYWHEVTYEFTVPAKDFSPPPKVESAVVSIIKKQKKNEVDFWRLQEFLDAIAWLKRKTLKKIRKMRKDQLSHFTLSNELFWKRSEELTWDDIKKIVW